MTLFDALALYAIGAVLIGWAVLYLGWRLTVLQRWLARRSDGWTWTIDGRGSGPAEPFNFRQSEEPDEHERGSV